jgi:NADP-dependent alcohol dehydrogenase
MYNFEYKNPVKIVFGKGTVPKIADEIPSGSKVLLTYGGGSIKRTGVYDQVKAALGNFEWYEFGGLKPTRITKPV